ncbi:MAG: ABC transporter substrate-binding protein [Blastocatellia bacterium]|nr:ABC transporter substrate-binding protein [Blastocatellia bacterium]
MKNKSGATLHRRRFLQAAGMTTGFAVASPLLSLGDAFAAPQSHLRVGLLLPQRSTFTSLPVENVLSGIRLGLRSEPRRGTFGLRAECVSETPTGGYAGLSTAVERLLAEARVDVLVGFFGNIIPEPVLKACERHHTALIVADAGANLAAHRKPHSLVFYNSLNYWQANWALGAWAARQTGQRAALVSSFYESGFDAHNTLRLGFEAEGGEIAAVAISRIHGQPFSFKQMFQDIRQTNPDCILAAQTGRDAGAFLNAYVKSGLHREVPLVSTGFTLDMAQRLHKQSPLPAAVSAVAWDARLATPANPAFLNEFRSFTHREADAFGVLGWEIGRLLGDTHQVTGGRWHDSDRVAAALTSVALHSPRGRIAMDARTQTMRGPVYLCEPGSQGLRELPSVDECADCLSILRTGPRSGWTNSFLIG